MEKVETQVEKMETQVGKMEAQLKKWGAKLDELVAEAEKTGNEAKVDYRKVVNDLKAKRLDAQMKLDEFKAAGSKNWDTFKAGVESAWKELEVSFKKLTK